MNVNYGVKMNKLADEQQQIPNKDLTEKEKAILQTGFNRLYYELRNKNENSLLSKMTISTKKRLQKMCLLVYTIKNHIGGLTYEIISDKRERISKPIIFAALHID